MVSKTDSFGIVYLESWAYGNPVLGCKNDAMCEVINDGVDGFLIDFDDVDGIAGKIRFLLENGDKRKEMGTKGFSKVKARYDWKSILKKVGEVYIIEEFEKDFLKTS